ncbi:hypothetical protein [Ferruginibacter sp. HRS2-29]|uniref:hypothetical protein n=1 Tax=Ferruginibacter sp. HRS2-29 TaxID=2487334 RepID=UPI0020CC5908|nr:hypothetical protein [Ferruginibacter sp. HRS2-29]MCP9752534.1 hypothetical protein [Ferruginibacter sp. HRS2-29]
MKKTIRIIVLAIVIILGGAFLYWQFIKKGVVKNALEKAVSNGTDSLYYVKYESSVIDELNGNATFTNIVMQSDSLQEKLLLDDTSVSATIFNVRIGQLKITGANIPSFLQKNTIEANRIEIIRPVITIINTGKQENVELSARDSLALYDRLTGKFKSIQAGQIDIVDATIAFAKGKKSPHTTLQDLSVTLKNLKIDSTRNYDNIISYFVKDVIAKVKQVNTTSEKTGQLFTFENIEYNAPARFLRIGKVMQKDPKTNKVLLQLTGNKISGISTNDFILNKKLKADSLVTEGGSVSIYRSKKAGSAGEEMEIDNDFFDEALISNIRLGNTTLSIFNKATPNAEPLILKNVKFNARNLDDIYNGTNLKRLIGNSNWNMAADGITLKTKDNKYKVEIGPFRLNNDQSTIHVNYIAVRPLLTAAEFVRQLKVQKDRFDIRVNNIHLTGADVRSLITDQKLVAENASMQLLLSIFNDRTVPYDLSSKIGNYPQQQLVKLDFPIYIKRVVIKNGNVLYRERGRLSKQTGDVTFKNINATIDNVTNIKEKIAANSNMTLTANTKFLGVANINTVWKLSLSSTTGEFSASGTSGPFDATKLSAITEPLGAATIKKGNIVSLKFDLKGDDLKASGTETLLYNNLKISLLKANEDSTDELRKKGLVSLVANIFTKDQNPSNGNTRSVKIENERDITKSFFFLLWKSVFVGAKRTTAGKNDF